MKIKPTNNEPCIRVLMQPKHLNHHNTVFGGIVLAYIDQAGSIEAQRQAYHQYVTASIGKVDFKSPVFPGDVVSFYAKTTRIGRTSMSIKVDVFAEHTENNYQKVHVTEAELTYVAINKRRQPTPIFPELETDSKNISEK